MALAQKSLIKDILDVTANQFGGRCLLGKVVFGTRDFFQRKITATRGLPSTQRLSARTKPNRCGLSQKLPSPSFLDVYCRIGLDSTD
jgi:hypothetical protein